MNTKYCAKCKQIKLINSFWKNKSAYDGLQGYCKDCLKSPKTIARESVPYGFKLCSCCHTIKSINSFYKTDWKNDGLVTQCKECQKLYSKNHKERISNYQKNYRNKNKEQLSKQKVIYYLNNKDIWINNYRKNKKKINKNALLYNKKRKLIDIHYKIRCDLSTRLWMALKNNQKSGHTLELLGCSVNFLKEHLENQFTSEMSWENWGTGKNGKGMKEWHIDHIYPCASFDLSKAEEQKLCFNWSNLQPLWARDNLIKSDKVV